MKSLDGIKRTRHDTPWKRANCQQCYHVSRWVNSLPSRIFVGGRQFIYLAFDVDTPCKSYVITGVKDANFKKRLYK